MPRTLATARGAFKKPQDGTNHRKQLVGVNIRRMTAPPVRYESAEIEPVEDESVEDEPEEDESVEDDQAEDEPVEDKPVEDGLEEEESEEEETPAKKRWTSGCKPAGGKRKRDESDDDDDDGNGSDNEEDGDDDGESRPRKKARSAPTKGYPMEKAPSRWALEPSKRQNADEEDIVPAPRVEGWDPKNPDPGDLEWGVRGIIGERLNAEGKVEYLLDWEATQGHEWDPSWVSFHTHMMFLCLLCFHIGLYKCTNLLRLPCVQEPVEMLARGRDQIIANWEVSKAARARAEAEARAESQIQLDVLEALEDMPEKGLYPLEQREALFRRSKRAGRRPNTVSMYPGMKLVA